MDTTPIIGIIVAVIVVGVIAAVVYKALAKRRSERLREQFGPEYDRAVEKTDDPKQAEVELKERRKRRQKLELRSLTPEQRRNYEQRWSEVKQEFVDDPSKAVRDADGLVVQIMSARGYPVEEFDQRAADLSVDYPETTHRYRQARDISRANERGEATTEQLRRAVGSFRELIDALLKAPDRGEHSADGARDRHGGHEAGTHDADTQREGTTRAATSPTAASRPKSR